MRDVEDAYWELYFSYRDLEARKFGEASALETWRRIKAKQRVGGEGGEANAEAQARSQFFLFRSQVETALTNLFRVENRLRYLMGLSVSDGRLIRPSDEPTTAQVHFDWATVHAESLTRRVELRRQKWTIKRRELELVAAKNQLLPRLDAVGRYRWLGAGDDLIDSQRNGIPPFLDDSTAFESLTSGDFQEWEIGLQFAMPLGMKRGMAAVRHHQLLLARERAVLQDMELEVSHQVGDAVRDIDFNFQVAKSNFNRRGAAEDEVAAVEAIFDVGRVTYDLLLDAQRRRAEAESAFYRSLVDYNRAIMRMHYRKGSLLEYNGVYLAEGPWPGKAYFDAMRRARQRDAAMYLDYGYTRPDVMSHGPYPQGAGTALGGVYEGPVAGGQTPQSSPERPASPPPPAPGEIIPPPAEAANPQAGMVPVVMPVSYAEPLPAIESAASPATLSVGQPAMAPLVAVDAKPLPAPNPFLESMPAQAPPTVINPFGGQQTPSAATYLPTMSYQPPAVYETDANHSAAEAAAKAPGGAGY
jgi:hypothetical protein